MSVRLRTATLDWVLRHIEAWGDTDIFPNPFEYEAIRDVWDSSSPGIGRRQTPLRDYLAGQDLLNWNLRTARRCLSPKHHFGFRASTQLDPLDTILFNGLAYEIGNDLEAARIPANKEVVHSYRFAPDSNGRMFDMDYGFESFRRKSLELSEGLPNGWVVIADIADFYPRIYSHPLDNALSEATKQVHHIKALSRFLSALNHSVSYGIPVGPTASRLLAEVAISDVDSALLSEGYTHVRFVDDFRIFCDSERDAYSALAFLATTLFEHHGLTLQQHKTFVQPTHKFLLDHGSSESDKERLSLTEKFEEILEHLGIDDWYEPIDYDDLEEEIQAQIDALNLQGILTEQIESDDSLDILIVRFILKRLAQIDDDSATELVLDNLKRLYPVFKDCLRYLTTIRTLDASNKHIIGGRLLDLIDHELVGHLEFHRAWVLSTFASNADWNNEDRFIPIYNRYDDPFTRREIILALGRVNQYAWFKGRKRNFGRFEPWQRRAFLAAASCLPGDEAKHWYRSIAPQLDELEKAVVAWAKRNPFG